MGRKSEEGGVILLVLTFSFLLGLRTYHDSGAEGRGENILG